MSAKFEINLKIDGKRIPLKIQREKEELYRRAEKELNALTDKFRKEYRAEEDEDYLAMAALQMALKCVELEMAGNLESEKEHLRQIEMQLDDYLKEI